MANYSRINFEEIDNSSMNDGVEGYFTRSKLGSKDVGVSLFKYQANIRPAKAHSHEVQEEVYVVIKGSGQMLIDNEVIEVRPGDVIKVEPAAVRSFAGGPDGLEVIAVGGPKPEGGDGRMADAVWPE